MAIIKSAARQNLGQLIGANNPPVRVPDDSQRQYAWGKKEVDTFWSDILKFKRARKSGNKASAEYFIGPIVTITDDEVTTRSLLDGQQRLTTSTILIAAIRDLLGEMASLIARSMANNIQRDYVARKDRRNSSAEPFLTLSLFDRHYFKDSIQDWNETLGKVEGIEQPAKPSHVLIRDAYKSFRGHITSELSSLDLEDDRLDWLEELVECLVKGLVFVEIQTPTSSDANEVFETINSRGKDLSTVDLVRNFLMEKSRDDVEKERVNDAWEALLNGFERREEIEKFLRHFWVARHGDVRSHSLYATIRLDLSDRFEGPGLPRYEVRSFAADLENASGRYIELITCNTGIESLDELLEEIRVLSADAAYPLLLAVAGKYAYGEMVTLARAFLTYYVRWTVAGRRESTLLEEKVFALAKEISNQTLLLPGAIQRIRDLIPDDESFRTDFEKAPIPKNTQARYLLTKIEQHLRRDADVDDVVVAGRGSVHVERIYPQSPNDGLKLEDHAAWVNRLGNQTLLHGRKNRETANEIYPVRAAAYESSSILITTATGIERLWDSERDSWRPQGIDERQKDLARIAVAVWSTDFDGS